MNNNEKKVIYLRGHHLLCLQGYQGYGYDDNFKKNMENIISILKNEGSNVKVVLTKSPDDLCEFCPNLKDRICIGESNNTESNENTKNKLMHSINNRKIVSMDSKVLRKANIKKKKEYLFSEAVILVNNSFKYLKDAKRVCGKCEWKDKCLWYQSRE
nr:DUF1284 domain-containing protein [Methanobrevibacter arboriphilus]